MVKNEYDILIVDNEPVVIDSVVKVVSSEGLKVDSAEDVHKALRKLKNNRYRLIVCDIMMPDIDGFKFLIEKQAMQIDTPVIMTSGYSTIDNAVKSLLQGAIGFLPKPFTMNELMSRISRGLKYMDIKQMVAANDNKTEGSYCLCPDDYYRLGDASWVHCESQSSVVMGVCDLYLRTIESVKDIELLNTNDLISQGIPCAKFRSKNRFTYNLLSPVSGRIIVRNENILEHPDILLDDPYGDGWIYRITPSELERDLGNLRIGDLR